MGVFVRIRKEDKLADKRQSIKVTDPIRDQIADILRDRIISGELKPNQHLVAREISAEFTVSATPVKEAFRILESEKLVHTIARKGTVVTAYTQKTIFQFAKLRSAIEGVIANVATDNLSADEIQHMESLLERAGEFLDSGETSEAVRINQEFHDIIRNASKNEYMVQLIQNISGFERAQRTEALDDLEERKVGYREHLAILQAIKEHDGDRVEALMREHVRRSALFVMQQRGSVSEETAQGCSDMSYAMK